MEKNCQLKPLAFDFFSNIVPILTKITSIALIFIKILFYHNTILENIFFSRYYSKNLRKIAFYCCFPLKEIKISSYFFGSSVSLLNSEVTPAFDEYAVTADGLRTDLLY